MDDTNAGENRGNSSRLIFRNLFISFVFIMAIVAYGSYCLISPTTRPETDRTSFQAWYNAQDFGKADPHKQELHQTRLVESPDFFIDTLFRSMEGPAQSVEFYLETNPFYLLRSAYTPKLIWLTGYRVELLNDKNELISEDFLCHNNLNISIKNILPWKSNTLGTDTRIFTLTEGQTSVKLPKGFGVPVLSNQRLRVDFQVLNHNIFPIALHLKHRVIIEYIFEEDLNANMSALYQQSAFVTKQTAGPVGAYGQIPNSDDTVFAPQNTPKTCCSSPSFNGLYDFDPFLDQYERTYTGHWVIDDSLETLTTEATAMLNIKNETRVHFISVHVHPFCESLLLKDETTNSTIYQANMKNFSDKIGLSNISFMSSVEGTQLFSDHRYSLTSVYNKRDSVKHTAMATMFLYLGE